MGCKIDWNLEAEKHYIAQAMNIAKKSIIKKANATV